MKQVGIFLIGASVGIIGMYVSTQYDHFYHAPRKAIAVVHPTLNNAVAGTVSFTQEKDGLHVQATLKNLTPGAHGFHIHELGDASCETAMCTKEHFNPTKAKHGDRTDSHVHVGDMGNIVADQTGVAQLDYYDKKMKLYGKNNIIGRSVIVHAGEDDLVTQPSGKAGARIGCGVIGIAE